MSGRLFQKGDLVEILPAYRDSGDSEYVWVAVDDEEKGRVFISTINSEMRIKPVHVVQSDWIRLRKA